MIQNRLRIEQELDSAADTAYTADAAGKTAPQPVEKVKAGKGLESDEPRFSSGRSLLSLLLATDLVAKDKALALIPYFLFLALLGTFYIGNRHLAERKNREVSGLKKEIKELKWNYTSTKAELMLQSKQSAVAIRASSLNLWESVRPPAKIVIIEK